ncbi:MAG: TolC family outer membrane protein [Pseudomonadota bacterium]
MLPDILRPVALVASFAMATASSAETLGDALSGAYLNSGLLKQNQALLRVADENVASAVAGLRPIVTYSASLSNNAPPGPSGALNGSLGVNVSMMLYDFGNTELGVEVAKENVLATRQSLLSVESDVLLRAVLAYTSVRDTQSFVALRENNVRVITQQRRAAEDRFEVGEITRTDVSLAEASLAGARSGLVAEQGNLARAREEYRSAVGRYPGQLAPPPAPPSIPATVEQAVAIARQNSPTILQARHNVTAAEINIKRAELGLKPTLQGSGGVALDDDGDTSSSLGLTLSGSIYRGGALSAALRQARANRDASRAQLLTARLAVDQDVANAWANLSVAAAVLAASEEEVRALTLALRGLQEEARLGSRTTLDVLDQEQDLLDAQTNRVSAQTDRYVAVYQLLSAMGLLTADHLGLNVPRYDPAAYYNAVKDAPVVNVSPQGERLDRVLKGLGRE